MVKILIITIIVVFLGWFLTEATLMDTQGDKFFNQLKPGDPIKIDGELFYVYEKKLETLLVYNLFYNPIEICKKRITPLQPYKSLGSILIKKLKNDRM